MIQVFKTKANLIIDLMTESFKDRNLSHSLPTGADTLLPAVRTTTYGIEKARLIGNKLLQSCH